MWRVGQSSTGSRKQRYVDHENGWNIILRTIPAFLPLRAAHAELSVCPLGAEPALEASWITHPVRKRLSLIKFSIGTLHLYSLRFHNSSVLCQACARVLQSVLSFWTLDSRLHECLFSKAVIKEPSQRCEKSTSQIEKDTKVR